jgi:hypothetical protein
MGYPPTLKNPVPPGADRISFKEHDSDTGLNPEGKYGPTGDPITSSFDDPGLRTPREFSIEIWRGLR